MDERRLGQRRSHGGRRQSDPIEDLNTHPAPQVTPAQLAAWWGVSRDSIVRWIVVGYRPDRYSHPVCLCGQHRNRREWGIPTREAQWFEARVGFNLRLR